MLLDANAEVGSIVSSHIRDRAARKENGNGFYFHWRLRRFARMLPSTFDCYHTGNDVPLTLPCGFQCRRDLVAVPASLCSNVRSSYVVSDFVAGTARDDHFAVACLVLFDAVRDHAVKQAKPFRFDRGALKNPDVIAGVSAALHELSAIPRQADGRTHASIVTKQKTRRAP